MLEEPSINEAEPINGKKRERKIERNVAMSAKNDW